MLAVNYKGENYRYIILFLTRLKSYIFINNLSGKIKIMGAYFCIFDVINMFICSVKFIVVNNIIIKLISYEIS